MRKTVGVPITPTRSPSNTSRRTLSANLPESSAASNFARSSPTREAYPFSFSGPSADWFWKRSAVYSQNLPCSRAASAASAAFCASACCESG